MATNKHLWPSKKRKIKLTILASAVIIITIFAIKACLFFYAKPNIAVNYVAELNRISRPENYDPDLNAYFDYEKAEKHFIEYPERLWDLSSQGPGDLNDMEISEIKEWVNDNTEALQLLKQGSLKPYYWHQSPEENWNTIDIMNPSLSVFRSLTIAIDWRAKLYALESKFEEAFNDILIPYKLSNQLSGPHKTLVEQLVANALKSLSISSSFEILSNEHIEVVNLENFQQKLEEEISKSENKIYWETEKIGFRDMIQRIFTDDGRGNGHLIPREYKKCFPGPIIFGLPVPPKYKPSFYKWIKDIFLKIWYKFKKSDDNAYLSDSQLIWRALTGPDRKKTIKILDEAVDYLDKIQEKIPWQRHNQGIDIEEELKKILDSSILSLPDTKMIIEITNRVKTQELALVTTIALLRYRSDKGIYPESLSELVIAGYIKELPQDPYNDGPLTYKKTDDDFTLYTFGPDFDDDGGEILRNRQGNIRQWWREGDTVFWPIGKKGEKK